MSIFVPFPKSFSLNFLDRDTNSQNSNCPVPSLLLDWLRGRLTSGSQAQRQPRLQCCMTFINEVAGAGYVSGCWIFRTPATNCRESRLPAIRTVLACGPFSPFSSAKFTTVPIFSFLNPPFSTLS
jgi:hypothetical protein